MKKSVVIVSGPGIASDEELFLRLNKMANVMKIHDNKRICAILEEKKVDLILFEPANDVPADIEMVRQIKGLDHTVKIVLIDDRQNLKMTARAFYYGVQDAFRKPYKIDLIVERVNTLLQ